MNIKRFAALHRAIEQARKELEPYRTELADAIKSYTGPHYGGNRESGDRPINLLQLAVESLLQQLSSKAPQVLCVTHNSTLKSSATELELAMNKMLKKMDFEAEHRAWVLSAIFSVGIMEVGLSVSGRPVVDDEELPMTEVFCEAIMLDDFVFDTSGTKWGSREVSFWGHKYRMPLAQARENEEFDQEARENLRGEEKATSNGDSSTFSQGNQEESFSEMCEIWQIFVPEENEVITFSLNGKKPLKTVKWRGPAHGPYHFMGFNQVLKNVMPLSPVANWMDIDDLENRLYSKLGNQAGRQKTIGIADLQAQQDGKNIIKTNDGDVIAVGNPNAFKEARFGGVDQNTLGFALNVRSMADFVMGNLSAQMGLGASAGTLGQEQMIRQAANVRIEAMQGVLMSATEKILRDIAFYLHHHPTIELNITREFEGTDIKLDMPWPRREDGFGNEYDVRQGEYDDYEINIVPYSMTAVSPGQRASLLRQIWREDVLAAVQLGVVPNVNAYFNTLAKYLDLPELRDIVTSAEQAMNPMEQLGQSGGGLPTAGKPNGNYKRQNVSQGMTPQAMDQQREMMALSGAGAE